MSDNYFYLKLIGEVLNNLVLSHFLCHGVFKASKKDFYIVQGLGKAMNLKHVCLQCLNLLGCSLSQRPLGFPKHQP